MLLSNLTTYKYKNMAEKFEHKAYRGQLAKDLKGVENHKERASALESEKEGFRYKQAKEEFLADKKRRKEFDKGRSEHVEYKPNKYKNIYTKEHIEKLSESGLEEFIRKLKFDKIYLTADLWEFGYHGYGDSIKVWVRPPLAKDSTNWESDWEYLLAENVKDGKGGLHDFIDKSLFNLRKGLGLSQDGRARKLVERLTKGEKASYELIEEDLIKDRKEMKSDGRFMVKGYDSWVLERKSEKA